MSATNTNETFFPPPEFDRISFVLNLLIGLGSFKGIIFNVLCLKDLIFESPFNYIYSNMLFLSLLYSLIHIPALFVGIYLKLFQNSLIYCQVFQIHGNTIFAGFVYLLMWTSLERHRYMRKINVRFSVVRRRFPLIVVWGFVGLCSILIVFLPKCLEKTQLCEFCLMENVFLVILFTIYTFFLPICTMVCSTGIFFWRLIQHRMKLNHHRRWIRLKRMFFQLIIYLLWYSITYWPYTIYSLFISSNPHRFNSNLFRNFSFFLNIYGIELFPFLTYLIFKKKNKYRISQWNWFALLPKKSPPIVERF